MVTKAFSLEDGNLSRKTLLGTKTKEYKDIDLTFTNKPSGDIYKKNEAASVKQAVKNLLLTNTTEKPFEPYYGGDLNAFLFSLSEDFDVEDIRDYIFTAVSNYEPRALVIDVQALIVPDRHDVKVTVVFQVVNTSEVVSVDITLARLR